MSRKYLPWALVLLLPLALFGCSEDPTSTASGDNQGIIEGEIDPSASSFEYVVAVAGDPSNPIAGPFAIIGSNIRYDESASVLLVDLVVENRGRTDFPEPVTLTFLDLRPDTVTVENPDNDEHGPGAMIVFEFDNDDNMWTAGESSFPRTVAFGVAQGVSIGFAARIDVGIDPRGGTIGGVVWLDENENGERDPDEPGIAGIEIFAQRGDSRETMGPEILYRAVTNDRGMYRIEGLPAGFYIVRKSDNQHLRPTTPTTLEVVLVSQNGDVGDFLEADFGCARRSTSDDIIVGDYLFVEGQYDTSASALGARIIRVSKCAFRLPPFDPCPMRELRGPVTDVDPDNDRRFEVMGSWVNASALPDTIWTFAYDPIEVGERVIAIVQRDPNESDLIALGVGYWRGDQDGLQGIVEKVFRSEEGALLGVQVLGVRVILTHLTTIPPPQS